MPVKGISWQPLRVFRLDALLSAILALQLLCAAKTVCTALSARVLAGTSRSCSALLSATAIFALARLQFEKTQLEQRNKMTNVKHETNKFHLLSVQRSHRIWLLVAFDIHLCFTFVTNYRSISISSLILLERYQMSYRKCRLFNTFAFFDD